MHSATGKQFGLILDKGWLPFSLHFLRQDISRQYERTSLGILWLFIAQTITISGIAIVYSMVFKTDLTEFFPYVAISILSWNLISGIIGEAPRVYHAAGPILNSFQIPYATFAIRMVLRHFVTFAFGLPIFIIVALFSRLPVFPAILLIFVNIPLLFLLLYPACNVLGILGARFRDIAPIMNSVVYLMFLISPVLYDPSRIPGRGQILILLNPFYYLLEFVRRPFLGEVPSASVYAFVIVLAVASWIASSYFNRRFGRYLVFWV